MPDSEEKKELGGLARTIDSLFSGEGVGAGACVEPPESTPGAAEADATLTSDTPTVTDGGPVDGGVVGLIRDAEEPAAAGGGGSRASAADPRGQADGPATVDETPDPGGTAVEDVTWTPPETVAEADGPDTEGSPEADGEPEGLSPAGDAAAPEAETSEPTPLELAVASLLAGQGGADRVRTLAVGHVEAREFDPVTDAVLTLGHEDGAEPYGEAMQLARELLTPIVRSRLVQRLGQERSEGSRLVYHDVCAKLGEEMALAIRDAMAEETDRFARRAYFDAMIAMGEVSRPVIEAMTEDENRFLARNGVAILGEIGGPRAEELVVGGLANTDPRVRREALKAMARLKVADADEIIVGRLVDDTDETVRLAAVVAAGELRVERAVRPLVEALGEQYETDSVLPLLHALGQIGDPGSVAAIERHAVKDSLFARPRTDVRIAAYRALSRIRTPRARRLLNQALSDKDPEVKAAVKEMLHVR